MAACRVVIGILPGLEVQVLADTEGLIKRFFDWAENSKEPLQSYATGKWCRLVIFWSFQKKKKKKL